MFARLKKFALPAAGGDYSLILRLLTDFGYGHRYAYGLSFLFMGVAAAGVLNLLISALGRDVLTLIGLVTVMVVQDPILSVVGFLVMPVAILFLRHLMKRTREIAMREFVGGLGILETLQETIQGLRI